MSATFVGEAARNLERLKRFQALETRLARLLGGWLPGVRRWEVKHEVALHLWQGAEASRDLRTRLWELRVADPDGGTGDVGRAVEALAVAQHDDELLAGAYLVVKRGLRDAYERYAETTYGVYDFPSIPLVRTLAATTGAQVAWAERVVAELTDSGEKKRRVQRWLRYADDVLAAIGGVDGAGESEGARPLPPPPPGYSSRLPLAQAERDERFEVQLAGLPMPDKADHLDWLLWQFANYAAEMQAAETLGSMLWEVEGMPWEFYFDIARHCWDEARHARLGETRLGQLGYHVSDFPCSVGSYAWRQLFSPLIRYCALTYVIEAGSFKLKHDSYQEHLAHGDIESAQAVMFDIVDETMHVRWGSKWVPNLMEHYGYGGSLDDLVAECRSVTARHSVAPAQQQALERERR